MTPALRWLALAAVTICWSPDAMAQNTICSGNNFVRDPRSAAQLLTACAVQDRTATADAENYVDYFIEAKKFQRLDKDVPLLNEEDSKASYLEICNLSDKEGALNLFGTREQRIPARTCTQVRSQRGELTAAGTAGPWFGLLMRRPQ